MSQVVLSSRAQLIYEFVIATLPEQDRSPAGPESPGCDYSMPFGHLMEDSPNFQTQKADDLVRVKPLRQQTLADHFQCSRRTVGRCLTELKAAGLLADTGKRENRVKVYWLSSRPVSRDPWIPHQVRNDNQRSSSPMPNGHLMEDNPDFQTSKTDDLVRVEEPRYITLEPFYGQNLPPIRLPPGETLNPKAADQWRFYYKNIRLNLLCYDGKNGRPRLEDIYASLTKNLNGKDDMEVFKNMFQLLKGTPYYEACEESYNRERLSSIGQLHDASG